MWRRSFEEAVGVNDPKPIEEQEKYFLSNVVPCNDVLVALWEEELVGFMPFSKFEFVIDGQRLYRVMNKFITIKYEYQGDEEAYNPSWAQSS